MKVQLIHPPHPAAIDDRLDAPLGLLYVAAALLRLGHEVIVTDLSGADDPASWPIEHADLYGVTSYVPTLHLAQQIAQLCKQKNPKAVVVGGGANFTDLVRAGLVELIPREFDSIVLGPGEEAIVDLVNNYPKVKWLYFHELSHDLDKYANPAYELVDLRSYSRKIGDERSLPMLTGRGCPFRCAFCTIDSRICHRSPRAVADEIAMVIGRDGIRSFNFQDDTFLLNRARVAELLKLLQPLAIKFRCHGRAGLDKQSDYVSLKQAGCFQICWGIESGSQRMLDKMKKGVTVAQNRAVIAWAQQVGLLDRIFLIVGFPGETRETIEETKRFIEQTNPSQIFLSSFQPYPGTDVWKHPKDYGVTRIYKDFTHYLQVYGDGSAGTSNIDTQWAKREEMEQWDAEFRLWLRSRVERGPVQDYERRLSITAHEDEQH